MPNKTALLFNKVVCTERVDGGGGERARIETEKSK